MNFSLFILRDVFLPSSEKTTVHKITHLLFCPPSSSKKRKLLLGASAGFPAEESSDSASYAIFSRLILSDVVRSAKWVPAGSAFYANGLASTPSSDNLARSAMTVKARAVRRSDCFSKKLQSNLRQLTQRHPAMDVEEGEEDGT